MIMIQQAVINAIRKKFPLAEIHGCNFHFTQNVWRHVQSAGLQTEYATNEDFAHSIRMLTSLAYIPVENVEEAFDQLVETDFYSEESTSQQKDQIQTLLSYFQNTYVYRLNRRSSARNSPLFPTKLWNCYESTLAGNSTFFDY